MSSELASLIRKAGLAGAEYVKPNPKPRSRPRGSERPWNSPGCLQSFNVRVFNTDPTLATATLRLRPDGKVDTSSTRHKCTLEAGHEDVHECNHGHQS